MIVLAWIIFVPLFFAIENKKPLQAFLIFYLAGVIFFMATVYWLIHVTLPGMIIVVLYLALYFGIFGIFCSFSLRDANDKRRTTRTLGLLIAIPAAWVALELLRSHFLTGFGWALLGYSQARAIPIIQIADITGAYGVSFIIVLVNVAIFMTIKDLKQRNYQLTAFMIAFFVLFASLYYGVYRMKNIFTGDGLKAAVVQGNIPQVKKWDPSFKEDIMKKYEALTLKAAAGKPDLIIWPETSVPGFMESEAGLADRVTKLAVENRIPLLVGAPGEGTGAREEYFNSAILLGEDGKILGHYDKIHLVPFGEYLPFRRVLSFVENFAPSPIGDFAAGRDYTVFNFFQKRIVKSSDRTLKISRKIKFSTLICFEDIFPEIARKFVNNGAMFLVNMTNDAWFGRTQAAEQHTQSSVFRAVENRVNVIRAANTGISCFINQKGQITGKVEYSGQDIFVDGFKTGEITLAMTRTFYTVHGDVFAYACVLVALAFIISGRKKWSG